MKKQISGFRGAVLGAAAGAAGTTALNAVTYLDMVWRARPASEAPEKTVAKIAHEAGMTIPGDEEERTHRLAGLGPLSGLLTGVGTGAVVGMLRARTPARRTGSVALLATGLAMVGSNGPMTALGITDPKQWSVTEWASDIVPHVAFGLTTALVLHSLADR